MDDWTVQANVQKHKLLLKSSLFYIVKNLFYPQQLFLQEWNTSSSKYFIGILDVNLHLIYIF